MAAEDFAVINTVKEDCGVKEMMPQNHVLMATQSHHFIKGAGGPISVTELVAVNVRIGRFN